MKRSDDQMTKTSRFLCYLLRHNPSAAGITLDPHGYTDVQELINAVSKTRPFDRTILEQIVETDEKGRYAFSEDKRMIRCTQGHSIPVDLDLEEKEPPAILYHGSCTRFAESIETYGLRSQTRQYIHLSTDYQTAVKVGARHGEPVVYAVDAAAMFNDGYQFFLSANKIWLCQHIIPSLYLTRLTDDTVSYVSEQEEQ